MHHYLVLDEEFRGDLTVLPQHHFTTGNESGGSPAFAVVWRVDGSDWEGKLSHQDWLLLLRHFY